MEYTEAYNLLVAGRDKSLFQRLFSISSWVVKLYLRDLKKECAELSLFSIDVLKSIIIAEIYGDDVRFLFYMRYRNGKVTRTVLGKGEYLDKGLCPCEFLDLFKENNEVIVARNCHNTN